MSIAYAAYLCIASVCLVYQLCTSNPRSNVPPEVRGLVAIMTALYWPLVLLAYCAVFIRLFARNLKAEYASERRRANLTNRKGNPNG